VSGLKSVIDDWCNHPITTTIVLITDHFSNSAKFRGNVDIRHSARNSAARGKLWALLIVTVYEAVNLPLFAPTALMTVC